MCCAKWTNINSEEIKASIVNTILNNKVIVGVITKYKNYMSYTYCYIMTKYTEVQFDFLKYFYSISE